MPETVRAIVRVAVHNESLALVWGFPGLPLSVAIS